ncbi:MAG TPA: M48 family metallopeptidase [Chthoniobacteraceae bacterium]|jgi:predicted Zn-dependent protease
MKRIQFLPIVLAVVFIAWKYFTAETFVNPETGQKHRVGMSEDQEQRLGLQSYQQVLSEAQVVRSGPEVDLVKRVAGRLAGATGEAAKDFEWAVSVVQSDQINAFCLPGGKIVVYTGILPVAQNEAGLATVMGHEMAHATGRHGSQRMLQSELMQAGMMGAQVSMSDMDYQQQRTVIALLGGAAQYGAILPFNRGHETEADRMGLAYMARAGYDPREAIEFWKRMARAAAGGQKPPEFASTHPSDNTRIANLERLMPEALKIYEASGSAARKSLPK